MTQAKPPVPPPRVRQVNDSALLASLLALNDFPMPLQTSPDDCVASIGRSESPGGSLIRSPKRGVAAWKRSPLAALGQLELISRRMADGLLSGKHRSTHRGGCTDFTEHRPYAAGDDVRMIDWRMHARNDRYHIKQYEDETNLRAILAVDASGSMAFDGKRRDGSPKRRASLTPRVPSLRAWGGYLYGSATRSAWPSLGNRIGSTLAAALARREASSS